MIDFPTDGPWPDVKLVTVFRASDAGEAALAKSMLQEAGIEFCARNEEIQDVFGWGRFPGGVNLAMGPVELQVREPDAAYAAELLQGIQAESPADLTPGDEG